MSFKLNTLTKQLILSGLISTLPIVAQADVSTEQRIDQLEQQIKDLKQLLLTQQETTTETKKVTDNAVIAKTNGRGLKFESADGNFVAQVGGRLQADAAVYSGDIPSGDGTDLRRLFLDVRGQVYRDWAYRFQYDFARPGENSSSRGIRDAYIKYTGFDTGNITIGQFKAPFGLEHLTGSLDTTFLERGLPFLFTPDRRIGVGFDTTQRNWTFAVAALGGTAENETNASDDNDDGWNLVGRVTATPWRSDHGLVHLGAAVRENWTADNDSNVRFRERPEVAVDGARLIDTAVIDGVDKQRGYGLEFATVWGPFSFQSEYVTTELKRDNQADLDFDSWYAYASYFLTGESRQYDNGIFGRVKPDSRVGNGGIGAWEVGLRYSAADLTDQSVIGGELDNLTAGVNWYATDNIRFAANYIHVLDIKRQGNAVDSADGDILALRGQIDF